MCEVHTMLIYDVDGPDCQYEFMLSSLEGEYSRFATAPWQSLPSERSSRLVPEFKIQFEVIPRRVRAEWVEN